MSYKEEPKFLEMKEEFNQMAEKVKNLSVSSKLESPHKSLILNQLLISLIDFEDHIKDLILLFPTYYQDQKSYLDNLLRANDNFVMAVHKEILDQNLSSKNC